MAECPPAGVGVERIGRISPPHVGSEVPRLNFHVQSQERGSHEGDYYCWAGFGKAVVSLCGEDAAGRVVMRRTLRREVVLAWFAQRAPCVVGMEACASAHWVARELAALGHTPRSGGAGPIAQGLVERIGRLVGDSATGVDSARGHICRRKVLRHEARQVVHVMRVHRTGR